MTPLPNFPPRKLAPSRRGLLDRIRRQDGRLLVSQVTANGEAERRTLEALVATGLVIVVEAETRDAAGQPVPAPRITAAGLASLAPA